MLPALAGPRECLWRSEISSPSTTNFLEKKFAGRKQEWGGKWIWLGSGGAMSFLMTMQAFAWRQPPGIWNTTPSTPNGVTTSGVEATSRPTRMTDVGKDQHPWGPPCRCEVWKSFTSLGFGKAPCHGLEKPKKTK